MENNKWISITQELPEEGVIVNTKIANPDRNEAKLVRKGNIWFFPDMSMYVYYTPTHWHYKNAIEK